MQTSIKIPLRKRAAGFLVTHHRRIEEQREDGVVYAVNIFAVMSPDGGTMVEETPDGPRPVLLASIPQPVRRAVLASAGLVIAR